MGIDAERKWEDYLELAWYALGLDDGDDEVKATLGSYDGDDEVEGTLMEHPTDLETWKKELTERLNVDHAIWKKEIEDALIERLNIDLDTWQKVVDLLLPCTVPHITSLGSSHPSTCLARPSQSARRFGVARGLSLGSGLFQDQQHWQERCPGWNGSYVKCVVLL